MSNYLMSTPFLSDLIPDSVVKVFGEIMMKIISPSYTDEDLKMEFPIVWFLVADTLSKVSSGNQKGLFAIKDLYEERVRRLGEAEFCVLLRDAVISKDWHSFLKTGIFLNYIISTGSSVTVSRHI